MRLRAVSLLAFCELSCATLRFDVANESQRRKLAPEPRRLLRRDLADQGLHGFLVVLLAAALRDEAFHLASTYAEGALQHIGRELAPLGADMELEL